ncbi:MAG TPA: PTS transporter subunit EIIC [Myxococcaceae bacterium]|nr:PTS transporter subunit EIIC [Myxococcaceae bacterium]
MRSAGDPSRTPLSGVRGALQAIGEFFSTQRHLVAVRDGIVGALPLVLIGSVFLLAAQPPSAALQRWVAPFSPALLVPYRALGGMISLYVTFSAAHSLAKSYDLDAAASGLIAMASFLVAAIPTPNPAEPALASMLPLQRLGAQGIFAGLLIALGTVELGRLFVRRGWIIRMPKTAPEMVIRSFLALIPGFAAILVIFVVTHVLRLDLVYLAAALALPLLRVTGSFPAALAVVLVDSGLWLVGVHATAALGTMKPLWEAMLLQNMEAASQGIALPHVASLHFYLWFVWQGGSGAALPLALLLLRSRSAQLKAVGRLGIVPALCNISEPVLFGVPVVLNPQLAIPFFLAPLALASSAYLAFHLNWVTRPYLEVPWTLPAPAGAFLSTGGDPRALILQMANLLLALAIYWPFLRRYDHSLQHAEARLKQVGDDPSQRSAKPVALL